MSRPLPRISGTLGIVHRAGDEWRVLVVDASGATPRVRSAETVPASSPDRVRSMLEDAKPELVLQVVPAAASVCRTCTLPDAEGETLDAALRLQAETWLLAGTPEYRYGAAVLPKAAAESSRTGLVASWPEAARVEPAPAPGPVRWIPEPVAMAALLDAERPAEPLVSIDRGSGSVALALCHPGGAAIRATHVDLEGDWRPPLQRVLVETALGGDQSPAFARRLAEDVVGGLEGIGEREAACVLPAAVRDAAGRRLRDAGGDDAWWRRFGVAAGGALAATGPLAPAAMLERDAVVETPSITGRVAEAIARPRTAAITVAACVLLLAGLPLITSGLRLAILQSRHGDVASLAEDVAEARARLAMYDALETRSFPMTKLLGDIANSTPEGINLINLLVSLDQRQFQVRGEAIGRAGEDARQRVLLMQQRLLETDGLFTAPAIDWDVENNFGAYGFDLDATIDRPFARPDYPVERDFGVWTAWMRQQNMPPPDPDGEEADELAGTGATTADAAPTDAMADAGPTAAERPPTRPVRPTSTPRPTTEPSREDERSGRDPDDRDDAAPTLTDIPRASDDDRSSSSRVTRGPRTSIGQQGRGVEGGSRDAREGEAFSGGEIPEPLTADQIDTMERSQVLDYMRRVGAARSRIRGVDGQEALEERLSNEFELLKARLREIGREGASR